MLCLYLTNCFQTSQDFSGRHIHFCWWSQSFICVHDICVTDWCIKSQRRMVGAWLCRTKELSPSDSGQLSPAGSSSNPSPPDVSGSPVGTSMKSTTFMDPYIPGSRATDSTTRPSHNIAPVGLMNMQQPSSSFTHQPLSFVSSVGGGGHHLSLFSDTGFMSSRQPKPSFDQPLPGNCCSVTHSLLTPLVT